MPEVKPKLEVKQPLAEDFAKKYQQLCEEMGFRIVVNPVYISRDDGTFSTQLQYSVGKLSNLTKPKI